MKLTLSFVTFTVFSVWIIDSAIPQPRVLITLSLKGSAAIGLDVVFLAKQWQLHLNERLRNVPNWPFNATVEFLDLKNNVSSTVPTLAKRVADTSLPPVTMVIIPEEKNFADPVAAFCTTKGIPLLSLGNPQPVFPRLAIYGTSFFVQSYYVYQYIELVNAYIDKGVQTVVTLYFSSATSALNLENCGYAGQYAVSRGITLVKEIDMKPGYTNDDITNVVRNLRDVLKPDAVLWCDIGSTLSAPSAAKPNIMTTMRNENYLPKVLTLLDSLDAPALDSLKATGALMYVTGGTLVCNKVSGSDFTEGNHDYSSMFRPSGTVSSIYDQLNFGSTASSPSSSRLYYAWYVKNRNRYPNKLSLAVWAAFDVVEAGLYRASKITANVADGLISWEEMRNSLKYMQISTPYGVVEFDDNGDNIAYKSLVVQALSTTDTADIIYPASARTGEMVYPMPTWDERVYTWALLKDGNIIIAIIVAAVCSLLILAIIITVIIKRKEPEIRMLNYFHLLTICWAGLVVIWSLVFLWQFDNRPLQCQSFMWAVYLPASYMVQLVNVKAYRLSLFLVATATGMRPKPFSHLKVLRITLISLIASAIVLGIIQAVDPPVRTLIVNDQYRPKLNEYRCVIGQSGTILLYILVVFHLFFSAFCVAAVRNGMEDFRDGMIIKEAITLLYLCLGISFIMGRLNLSSSINYLLRTVILTLGITLFLFRFLGSRVVPYWIPESLRIRVSHVHEAYLKPLMVSMHVSTLSHVSKSNMMSMANDDNNVVDFDAPVYVKDVPKDDNLQEMIGVLKDPKRKRIFTDVAKQALTVENVDFLCKVMNYEDKCALMVSVASSKANDEMREEALNIFDVYVKANSAEEVNVSSHSRNQVDKKLAEWSKNTPVISKEDAQRMLEADILKRSKVFQTPFHEVSIMTYQNLWNKFRVAETNYLAMGQEDVAVKDLE